MSVQNKPDYKIFASGAKPGEVISFPDILRGWGVTLDTTGGIPPLEFFNSASMRLNEWLMYLTQRGVPEWDAVVDYPKSAVVMFGDVFYVSLKATKNEKPSTSQSSWSNFASFFGIDGKVDKQSVVQALGASTTNVMSQKVVTDELNKKFDKTGGTITATSKALEIKTRADASGYIQISDENGAAIHQLGKTTAGNKLILRNVIEDATLTVGSKGVEFNGVLLGLINTALNGNNGGGWWRCGSTGVIIQWGRTPIGATSRPINFPIPFTDAGYVVSHFDGGFRDNTRWGTGDRTKTGFIAMCNDTAQGGNYIAIGF